MRTSHHRRHIMSPRRRIVLFSPYPPNIGGGSVILKSLIPQLEAFNISWLYTGLRDQQFSGATWIGPGLGGGSALHDLSRTALLWSRMETPRLDHLAQELMSRPADVLMRRGARVHLTVQDDVPDGIFGRSNRYRLLAPLARPTYQHTLKQARSVDVISEGMRRYYASHLACNRLWCTGLFLSCRRQRRPRPAPTKSRSVTLEICTVRKNGAPSLPLSAATHNGAGWRPG
jgi:hypothetical protein